MKVAERTTFVLAVLAAFALAFGVNRVGAARAPQTASGDDVLSVVFGDARAAIGDAMFHKADSYFHGGVDMDRHDHDCEMEHHHGVAEHGGHGGHDDHDGHHEHGEHDGHDGHGEHEDEDGIPDPWRWINSRIRAPQVERHLEGGKAVELMPWFWASVKANPHNIEAWTTTWYIARHKIRDAGLARRVLEEAKAKNPDSLEIALCEARHVYDSGRGDLAAAEPLFRDVRDRALSRCGGEAAKLEECDRDVLRAAEMYLEYIERKRREGGLQ